MTPDRSGARRVAGVSLAVAVAVAAVKLGVGLASGSLALLSDAVHSTLDAAVTVLTLFAVRLADKPPDREHPFGHGRAENLAALGEAAVLIAIGLVVGAEAVGRLRRGEGIEPAAYTIVVAGASIVVDAWRAWALRRAAKRYASQALEADAANFTADVAGSTAVLAGLAASRAGFEGGDAIAALTVVGLVCLMGVRLAIAAIDVLMDRAPEGLEDRLRAAALAVPGVHAVSGVRVRRAGPHALAEIEVRVGRTESVERSHDIAETVSANVARDVPGATALVHVEPSRSGEDVVRRVFAAANRLGLADQIHNVLAIEHPEGIWLMLHAKVDPSVRLRDADQITDAFEAELRLEIASLARVEIHLEPHEPKHLRGRTVSRPELAAAARAIAESVPPIGACHEVAMSLADERLHVVLHCDASPDRTIGEIHDASTQIEAEVHRRFAEVATVTVHFEPSTAARAQGDEADAGQ